MMKTKKDLAKYLADYLWHEIEIIERTRHYDIPDFENILEHGLKAFESTKNVIVLIANEEIMKIMEIIQQQIRKSQEVDYE